MLFLESFSEDRRSYRVYYQGFDWTGLLDRSLSPPLLPSVNNTSDSSNFDQFPRDTSVPTDENSGWDKDF